MKRVNGSAQEAGRERVHDHRPYAVAVRDGYDAALSTYASAARSFARLVADIPPDRWSGPGLGEWNLRSLVGHTSRSLTTVNTYLSSVAERIDIASPQEYFAHANAMEAELGSDEVVERGRQAGKYLGADPAASVHALVDLVLGKLSDSGDHPIQVIGGLGIRLRDYLPTRTFELAVHSMDIAMALDVSFAVPEDVLTESTALAGQIAVAIGAGETVLMSLTGRRTLPESFSVVR